MLLLKPTQVTPLKAAALAGISTLVIGALSPAVAQSGAPVRQSAVAAPEEIIVTARKRDETIMKAPVIISAIPQKTIENLHLTSVEALSSAEPGLKVNYGFALSGITINLRGLSNGVAANYIDQSVALNLDGFTSNSGSLFRTGLFDVAQIEVMKGPQALFYGKSTSAGLIAIHSADPTKTWDAKVTAGYEFKADEMDLDGYISGPLTDKLGIRIAGYHNTSKGYLTNPNPANPQHRLPEGTDDGARLTLKYDDPDLGLRVKFKASLTDDSQRNWQGEFNQSVCAGTVNPAAGLAPFDDCKLDLVTNGAPGGLPYRPDLSFNSGQTASYAVGTPSPLFRDGKSYGFTKTGLGVLGIDYDVATGLVLSSVTALDYVKAVDAGRNLNTGGLIDLAAQARTQEFSQELRLTSNWKDSWFNFMAGGLYNPSTRKDELVVSVPAITFFSDDNTVMKSETDSVFGQVNLTPIDKWELDAGVRYIHVNKHFVSMIARSSIAGLGGQGIQNVSQPNRDFTQNIAVPEVTLSYKPTDDITTFLSYKHGYKGPGFNTSLSITSYSNANSVPFGGEKVKGLEGGVKARLLDHQLNLSVSGYRYNYKGLQVSYADPVHSIAIVANGADARVQGFEVNADYSPESIRGLTLSAFLNYNDAYYTSFPTAPCYGNQTLALGCTTVGTVKFQNLTGRTLHLAAKWTGFIGGTYAWDLNDKYGASFDARTEFSSSYLAQPELHPLSRQKSYALLDLALHLLRSDGSWDLAALCRNCTDHVYIVNSTDGGAPSNPALISVSTVNVARPRQVMLQLTVHPNLL